MAWRIEFSDSVRKELSKLDRAVARLLLRFLSERVAISDDPRFMGSALKGKLGEYWRYRVGDYRLVCQIKDSALCVLVLRVAHRSKVYRN